MKERTIETVVGVFVFIGILCVGYMTVKLGRLEWFDSGEYAVFARFQSITGLKSGADVEMAGVTVGKVESIALDPVDQVAVVKIRIRENVELTDDVIASVKTAGLIGDKYIKLSPGGSDVVLKPGETITETESAVDLEELISKYVFGDV